MFNFRQTGGFITLEILDISIFILNVSWTFGLLFRKVFQILFSRGGLFKNNVHMSKMNVNAVNEMSKMYGIEIKQFGLESLISE